MNGDHGLCAACRIERGEGGFIVENGRRRRSPYEPPSLELLDGDDEFNALIVAHRDVYGTAPHCATAPLGRLMPCCCHGRDLASLWIELGPGPRERMSLVALAGGLPIAEHGAGVTVN